MQLQSDVTHYKVPGTSYYLPPIGDMVTRWKAEELTKLRGASTELNLTMVLEIMVRNNRVFAELSRTKDTGFVIDTLLQWIDFSYPNKKVEMK